MSVASQFKKDQAGTAAILFAVATPAIFALSGAAIAYGQGRMVKQVEQNALDSAVLTAATLPQGSTDAERINAAQRVFTSWMNDKIRNITRSVSAQFTVEVVENGDIKVSGTSTAAVKNMFASFVGGDTMSVGASAAAKTGASPPVCVYALNSRTQGAVDLNGNVNVSTTCQVQANSGSDSAVHSVGGARMKTTVFGVSGNVKGDGFTPTPSAGVPQLPDPFAGTEFPLQQSCSSLSGSTIKTNTTIDPGTFCGGLKISSGAVVTLTPGVYIFSDGEFKVDSGAQVRGTEVLLAFDGKGAKFWMTGSAVMKLTSPQSGPYTNMQFMENRNNAAGDTWVSIGGNSSLEYDGTMYFPLSNIWVFGGSILKGNSPNVAMLGDKLWFQDNSSITITQTNPRNLIVKDLSQKTGATLIR